VTNSNGPSPGRVLGPVLEGWQTCSVTPIRNYGICASGRDGAGCELGKEVMRSRPVKAHSNGFADFVALLEAQIALELRRFIAVFATRPDTIVLRQHGQHRLWPWWTAALVGKQTYQTGSTIIVAEPVAVTDSTGHDLR
jgi:hypothetical protein